jgi:hypothetical protein
VRSMLMTVVMVWGGSVAVVAVGFAAICLGERRSTRLAQPRSPAREVLVSEVLQPDERLLVPWAAVRASKQRLGVDEAVLRSHESVAPSRGHPGSAEASASGSDTKAA